MLDNDGIEMVFQPVADLTTGAILGVEALARFRSADAGRPTSGSPRPADVGLGVELELAAVGAALAGSPTCRRRASWRVNVSPAGGPERRVRRDLRDG